MASFPCRPSLSSMWEKGNPAKGVGRWAGTPPQEQVSEGSSDLRVCSCGRALADSLVVQREPENARKISFSVGFASEHQNRHFLFDVGQG